MTKENLIPKTETVYEIKNETPSFEEFMKTYKSDEKVNYDDLEGGGIGEAKGYGPMYRLQHQKLQIQKQMSVQEKKAIYDLFCASIERLEKYIESAKYYSDWENRKQIHNNGIKRNIIGDLEKAKELFSIQLFILSTNLKDVPNFFREELKQEFHQWINAAGINVKASGFGFSIGKKTGISTPFGEAAIDFDYCVVQ